MSSGPSCSISSEDTTLILGLSLAFPALRLCLDRLIFQRTSKHLLQQQGVAPLVDSSENRKRQVLGVTKLSEAFWKLFTYGSFLVLGFAVASSQPWFSDSREFWTDWPHQQISLPVKALFWLQLAYYLSTIFTLAIWEVPRKDFRVMMTHHCATVVLISLTYTCRYTRAGVMTMLLHDTNDVLMELAKIMNYCKFNTAANILFATFTLSWAVLRLFCFPYFIIWSTMFEVQDVLGFKPPFFWLFNVLFVALYCMHLYWFGLILRIVRISLRTGDAKDIREADDDEDS